MVAPAASETAFCARNIIGDCALATSRGLLSKACDAMTISRGLFMRRRALHGVPGRVEHAAQQLADRKPREARHDVGIAAPQAPRLRTQPKQPFQPFSLHPPWRLTLRSGQEVECGTHSNHDWGVNAPEVLRHPEFLLRRAQADPYDVRVRGIDGVDDRLI